MFGDLSKMMGQLQDAQKQVEEAKQKLNTVLVEGSSGNGLVNITVTANYEVKKIDINELVLEDKEAVEDYLILALNDALKKASAINEKEVADAAKKGLPFGL
ncbi:YbaB/EbfC family nucleoid-associated protein [Wenyingzhuangia sp. IMCC45574]